jgi:hypothetical protein
MVLIRSLFLALLMLPSVGKDLDFPQWFLQIVGRCVGDLFQLLFALRNFHHPLLQLTLIPDPLPEFAHQKYEQH